MAGHHGALRYSGRMEIQLVSHASVVVTTGDTSIASDPWTRGGAFNNSWELWPQIDYDLAPVESAEFLWISHEHPDHFHPQTLRTFSDSAKQNIRVLFQKNNSQKMESAFKSLGFRHFQTLPHRKIVSISPATDVYCYQQGTMNSALAIISDGKTVLNVNDAELDHHDLKLIQRDLGPVDVILNQFSVAGYGGAQPYEPHLTFDSKEVISNMFQVHRGLGAKVTVPFASYVRFCCEDNAYVNKFANSPADAKSAFDEEGLDLRVLFPGNHLTVGQDYDDSHDLASFATFEQARTGPPSVDTEPVGAQQILEAATGLLSQLHDKYPKVLLRRLRPMTFQVPDLGCYFRMDLGNATFEDAGQIQAPDLVVNSQPLWFALKHPFGFQTLGVSARSKVMANEKNWRWHRAVFSLNNAELGLKPKHLFQRSQISWLVKRAPGALHQLRTQIVRM